jgi:hypothetical protein
MGAFTAKPAQGILIDGKKYKDGAYVRRRAGFTSILRMASPARA